jgi:hypothetical protein
MGWRSRLFRRSRRLQRHSRFTRIVDHQPRVLVAGGKIQDRELARAGLTTADAETLLRQQGVGDLGQADYTMGRKTMISGTCRAEAIALFLPAAAHPWLAVGFLPGGLAWHRAGSPSSARGTGPPTGAVFPGGQGAAIAAGEPTPICAALGQELAKPDGGWRRVTPEAPGGSFPPGAPRPACRTGRNHRCGTRKPYLMG